MCMACGQMFSAIHWSDQQKTDSRGFADQRTLLLNRISKIRYTNQVLRYYGLTVSGRTGGGYTVSDKKGRSLLCQDFGDLWVKAQKLSGRPVDPLDPKLIAYLNGQSIIA